MMDVELDTLDKRLEPRGVKDPAGRYALVGDGDTQAFASLYDRHSSPAYSLAYRLMNGRQAAEDLVQEAFIKAWRSAGSYRVGRGSVRTWILSIVRNRAIDLFRSYATRRRMQEMVEADAP